MSWTTATLGHIAEITGGSIRTGPFGSQLHEEDYSEFGTPVVMPKDIVSGRVEETTIARISQQHVARLTQHVLCDGDIVYGRRGDIGRRGLVTAREAGWLCGTGCLRISLGQTVLDPRYLFYFLGEPRVVEGIAQQAVGATMPNLNTGILKGITVRYPPLPIQRRIAGILSAYDDLIENNTRRIAILEDMARRLFEEWFVRFRFPGGNGQMPDDWVEAQLGDIVSINPESISPKRAPDRIGYIDIASVSPGRVDQIQQMDFTEAPGRARRIVREGDVIWSNVRPNRRSFALLLNVPEHTVASTGFTVLRATDVPWSYLLMLTSTSDFVTYLVNRAKGSAYPAVGCSDFAEAEILMPNPSLLESYHSVVGPMLQNVSILEQQSASARAARDLLLPKLISGEIDVSSAEADGLPDHAPELLAAAE
jgi:type I restriction enzyme, S subunit